MSGTAVPDHPWLLPATLTGEAGAGGRRSGRDWLVDWIFFLVAVGYAWWVLWDLHRSDPVTVPGGMEPRWLIAVDAVVAVFGCLALWARRRWPVGLAVAMLPVACFSVTTRILRISAV